MTKKSAAKKAPKIKDFQFYVLNIKITSDDPVTEETYRDLFDHAFKKKQTGQITKERSGIIRQLFHDKETKSMYGIFCQFIVSDNKAMDINTLEIINFEIAKGLFFNPKEAQFVFFPELHRIGILKNTEISLLYLKKMLTELFNARDDKNMAVEVNIEQSSDPFKKILNAKEITSVYIDVSPSNADINKGAADFMDKDLKKSNIGKFSAEIRPGASGRLKTEGGKVLPGLFGLAQSNGKVKATIINEQENKEVVDTEDHPSLFKASSETVEGARVSLYNTLKKRFRDAKRTS